MARRRRGGISFTGILVIVALLYFTGAGSWLWQRVMRLEEQCHAMLAQIGTDTGSGACAGLGTGLRAADSAFGDLDRSIKDMLGGWRARFESLFGTADFSGLTNPLREQLLQGTSPLSGWVSSSDALAARLHGDPATIGGGASSSERIRAALDNFVIGQHYLQNGNDASGALPWLQQGAAQPGYGVLSQLALGDVYRNGAGDIAADPLRAVYYYQQAQASLHQLGGAGTPESQALLKSLPASPVAIQQQLTASIAQINQSIVKKK